MKKKKKVHAKLALRRDTLATLQDHVAGGATVYNTVCAQVCSGILSMCSNCILCDTQLCEGTALCP